MEIGTPTQAEWKFFRHLAEGEGWRVPARELELFRGPLAGSAFVLREKEAPRGFVTVVSHQRSGWIGNLIVAPEERGRGLGALLFDRALAVLQDRGATSVWLTASEMGRPLYEKKGFRTVGGIIRWRLVVAGTGTGRTTVNEAEKLLREDALVWGEERSGLLDHLRQGGDVLACGRTVALLQPGTDLRLLGPWISATCCPRENRQLLLAARAAAGAGTELIADVLETSPVLPLLAAAGFEPCGRCGLMARGPIGGIDLTSLVALASLGSMG